MELYILVYFCPTGCNPMSPELEPHCGNFKRGDRAAEKKHARLADSSGKAQNFELIDLHIEYYQISAISITIIFVKMTCHCQWHVVSDLRCEDRCSARHLRVGFRVSQGTDTEGNVSIFRSDKEPQV